MFGLSFLFAAFRRLGDAVNTTASYFEAANEQLAERLRIDDTPPVPALEAPVEEPAPKRNGRARAGGAA